MSDIDTQITDIETQIDLMQDGVPLTRLTDGSVDKTYERIESLHNVRSRLKWEARPNSGRVKFLSVQTDFR